MKNIQLEELKGFMRVENYNQRTIQIYLNSLSTVPNFPIYTTKRELHEHIKRILINYKLSHKDSNYKNVRAATNLWFRMKTGVNIKEYKKTLKSPSKFDDLLQSFYNYSVTTKQITTETADSECSHVRNFLEFAFNYNNEIIFTKISALTVRDYVCTKIATLSDSSKGRYVTSIRNFFRYLEYIGTIVHPSIFKIPLSPVAWNSRRVPVVLADDEIKKLLKYFDGTTAKDRRNYAIFLTLLDLGLRCSEIPSLKLNDIFWNRGEVVIRETKTHRERILPISARLGKALEEYIIYHRTASNSDLLFLNVGRFNGLPMNREQVRRIIRQAFQKTNITGWWKGTHTIRRTAVSKIYNSGNGLKITADILGHNEIGTTTAYTRIDLESLGHLAGQ